MVEKALDYGVTSTEALYAIQTLRRNIHKGKVAPHKPLLLLYTLGAWLSEGRSRFAWQELEIALQRLFREFGFGSGKFRAEYPFYHLASSGLWNHEFKLAKGPSAKFLRENNVVGAFSDDLRDALQADEALAPRMISDLLAMNFPESVQEELVEALPAGQREPELVYREVKIAVRDQRFRKLVMNAYSEKCALCSWDLKVSERTVGLDAAHIRWHSQQGPNTEANGLSLCVIHHRLFDRGIWTIDSNGQASVTRNVQLTGKSVPTLLEFNGMSLVTPMNPAHRPDTEHMRWHRETVYRG